MTLPDAERVESLVERWSGAIMAFCAVGTCLCFIGLAYLQIRVSSQASAGQRARELQCVFRPITAREQAYFHAHGVISAAEYRKVVAVLPPATCAKSLNP